MMAEKNRKDRALQPENNRDLDRRLAYRGMLVLAGPISWDMTYSASNEHPFNLGAGQTWRIAPVKWRYRPLGFGDLGIAR